MTQKQNDTQQNMSRPSVDGVDHAVELYREFDAALDDLFDEGALDDDAAFGVSASDVPAATDVSVQDFDGETDAEAYIKDDHLRIQFQGEKKQAPAHDAIGTRQYDDTPQSRDTVLNAYKASIRKEEALRRIARNPSAFHKDKISPVPSGRDVSVPAVSMPVRKRPVHEDVEVIAPPVSDLDTRSSLGGRAGLSAELAQSASTEARQQQGTTTAQRDAVRLHTATNYAQRRTQKVRPPAATELQQETEVVYRKRAHVVQQGGTRKRQKLRRVQSGGIKKHTPPVTQKATAPQSPQYFQLGRVVSPGRTEAPTVVASQYTPQEIQKNVSSERKAIAQQPAHDSAVTFFTKPKEDALMTQYNNRAHATLGTATFAASTPRQRSFAEIADRVRSGDGGDDAAFLDEGKITFTQTQHAPSSSEKTVPQKTAPVPMPHVIPQHRSTPARVQQTAPKKMTLSQQQVRKMQPTQRATLNIPQATKRTQRTNAIVKTPAMSPANVQKKDSAMPTIRQRKPQTASSQQVKGQAQIATQHQTQQLKKDLQRQAQRRLQLPQQSKKKAFPRPKSQQRHRTQRAKSATIATQRAKRSKRSRRRRKVLVTGVVIVAALVIFALALARHGANLYTSIKDSAGKGFASLQNAVTDVKAQDFDASQKAFQEAARSLGRANASFAQINSGVIAVTQYVPVLSKIASGKNAISVGQHIARAGVALSKAGKTLKGVGNPLSGESSLLKTYQSFATDVTTAREELEGAETLMDKISTRDIPSQQRMQFVELKERLPVIIAALKHFEDNNHIIADMLGANGPRKYLFLFQNNHEMRATGGFIGSYGRLDISNGVVRRFFIDGIFNPDGQLYEKIIPPRPIQKISAAWSLHDSNWFPHFPTSAEEAIVFYERTGGPTVDGVIAITPTVLQQLLAVTGPVHLPAYEEDITAENLMERLQQEVEVDYDKAENKPKKILSDLAPIVLERIFATGDRGNLRKVLDVIGAMLAQKHIQLYARNHDVQRWIVDAGWGGTIKDVPGDYLSVINTNINGFKTDGVVKETIHHWAEIQKDGSIIDTVRIVRKHTGGQTPYAWWNKVNADYMRVYVPQGSKLLHVSGQTREFVEPPLDYRALGFQADARVVNEEQSMSIDDETGTRTYVQNNKTVFANWVYVSPQETVTVEYVYRLPFRIDVGAAGSADTYSVFFQKQAGSIGSRLISKIAMPDTMMSVWSYPQGIGTAQWKTVLTTDQMRGVVIAPSRQ